MAQIEKVGVLGAGLMGHGIAQVAVQAGYEVVLREVDEATLAKGVGKIEKQLARAVEKGKSSQEEADAVRGRIRGTVDYGDLAECDLVIEAITESLPRKLEMWREVDAIVKPQAIFATNTSSLAVIDQAAATSRAERFVGLHYFNPAGRGRALRDDLAGDARRRARVHRLGGQAGDPHARQSGVHRQPPAGAVHARRDPCA
jgi:3-hydroxybutyryl-CoA dehydrogenase